MEVHSRKASSLTILGPENAQAYARRVGKVIVNRVPANAPFAMRLVQTVGKCLLTHNESVAKPIRDALGPLKTSILSQSLANLFALVDETFDQEERKAAIIVEKVYFFMEETGIEQGKTQFFSWSLFLGDSIVAPNPARSLESRN